MKGVIVNCKTGASKVVDDGKPFPDYPIPPEPVGLDLDLAKKKLDEIDQMKADIEDLKASLPPP